MADAGAPFGTDYFSNWFNSLFGHFAATQGFVAAPALNRISDRNPGIKGQTVAPACLFIAGVAP